MCIPSAPYDSVVHIYRIAEVHLITGQFTALALSINYLSSMVHCSTQHQRQYKDAACKLCLDQADGTVITVTRKMGLVY
jgi:hypothetical protein